MKNIILLLITLCSFKSFGQNVIHAGELDWYDGELPILYNQKTEKVMSCTSNSIVSSGYPIWTNYWAGYMIKINNISTCSITINCFEARFDGTSGYRIYTKTGTFVGFETTAGAWTLVGTLAGLTSISTIGPSPIPISVNVTIPPASSQSFYLTRTDNLVANRHLYTSGVGTAGTTVYASDANIQITEGSYVDPFFTFLNVGVRRPSLNVYYDKICSVLPIELIKFELIKKNENVNELFWITSTEKNNDYFSVERSSDAIVFYEIDKIKGAGNSLKNVNYKCFDDKPKSGINYYRLKQVDYDGNFKYSDMVYSKNTDFDNRPVRIVNYIGQNVDENYKGLMFMFYSDGTVIKKVNN